MESYEIEIILNNNKSFKFRIGNNPNISFDYIIEYLAYNYPSEKICPCFIITNKNKQAIEGNQKIIEYISNNNINSNKIKFFIKTPKKCLCNINNYFYYNCSKLSLIELSENYRKNNQYLKNEINKIVKEKQVLEMCINDPMIIDKLKKFGIEGKFLNPRENLALIDKKTNQIIGNEKKSFDKNFIDFYDVIIDIKSIKDIRDGWKIKMNDKGKEIYENNKKQKNIILGVIGNSNKGKSFLLSKISKTFLPSGYSIRTEGLSIKYPDLKENENKRIILLDSAGSETPVLKNNLINNNDDENENKIEKDVTDIKDVFKEKSREKLITELFLQNYIINNSDILLVVVGILTFSEQKLINKIKLLQKKSRKPLFIIHNLMVYTSIKQVEEYIQEFLLKSSTFTLEQGLNISTKKESLKGKYFYEKKDNPPIYHLIYANEGSEAGENYNYFTLQFIEHYYQNITNPRKFDVIETIKKDFIDISHDIFEKMEKDITMEDFDENTESIKLNNNNNISLKKCFIDELGFSNLTSNEFEPKYNCYKKDDKFIIKIECPGNLGFLNYSFKENEIYKIIKIDGEKKKDKEPTNIRDNLYTSREYGKFSIEIPFKFDDNYILKNENPKIVEKKGILFLEYQLEKIMKEERYIPKEEDEI